MGDAGRNIPVAAPSLAGKEDEYVADCLETTWISSAGDYIEKFERDFEGFCGTSNAICCSNGTTALHLALEALDIGAGDEVIVPDLTFVATANAVTYTGATPVFADVERQTWNLAPESVERQITPRTRAIIPVHLYGHPADMEPILNLAADHDLAVIEDAAEAHGATYKGEMVGTVGDIGTFSFYGNKILTTGEGGMVVTDDDDLADRVRQLRGQGMDPERRYWFPMVGYNYRMTNIQAAIGLAQLERADWHLDRRREIATAYRERLSDVAELGLPPEREWAENVYWMFSVLVDGDGEKRETVRACLEEQGIETRPFFYPMHTLPPYREDSPDSYPVTDDLARRGINLPTWAGLDEDDIDYVCTNLVECLQTI